MKTAETTQSKDDVGAETSSGEASALETQALQLTTEIAGLDKQIAGIKSQRAAKHRELRAVTSKLVTAKLRGE
jgi:hypothetical protein